MALTQMQLIQSLGEAMTWFERELNWGVAPTELRHLCGRIGELYVALITNGQMAPEVNQRGYDVVSGKGERISVKTSAKAEVGAVAFTSSTLDQVDRVIVLRMNTEEMQIEVLVDAPIGEVLPLLTSPEGGKRMLSLGRLATKTVPRCPATVAAEVEYLGYIIREMESGTIEIERDGLQVLPVKPALRELAAELNVGLLNGRGNPLNTRQLGTQVIQSIRAMSGQQPSAAIALSEGT